MNMQIYLDQIIYKIAIVTTWKQKLKCYYSLLWQINMQVSIYFPFFQKIYSVLKHIITFFLHYSAIVILYLIYLLFIAMTIDTKFNNKLSSLCFFSGIIIIISCISWLLLKTTLLEGMLKNDLLQVFNMPHTPPSGWSGHVTELGAKQSSWDWEPWAWGAGGLESTILGWVMDSTTVQLHELPLWTPRAALLLPFPQLPWIAWETPESFQ